MPTLPSRRPGALRLALACLVFGLMPAAAEAFTTRYQRAGLWRGHQAQRIQPLRTAKRAPVKAQAAKPAPAAKPTPAAKPMEAAAPGKPSEQTGTWTAGEPGGRACFRSRRKLWQADEGWVVKKVNVCP